MQSDLDLSLIVDEVAAKRKGETKTHIQILQLVASKLAAEMKTCQNSLC